jgi:hypothetical protein
MIFYQFFVVEKNCLLKLGSTFLQYNGSQTYTVYTGEGNPYNSSKISHYNGQKSLNIWNNDQCNKVQGSDGATFNPYIQMEDTLWYFNSMFCRSLPMVFDKHVMSRCIPGYRFKPRQDVFQNDPDSCYCNGEELCSMIGDGMFSIAKCQFDAPLVLSWPHFLHANLTFQQSVQGTVYFLTHFCPLAFVRQMKYYFCWHKSVSGR